MLCDECKRNQATVHLVAIIDGSKTERNLCGQCMSRQKLQMRAEGVQSMLSAIWNGVHRTNPKFPGLTCPSCGMAYDEFSKTSRLGCAHCYSEFHSQLKPLLLRLHGRAQHIGRVPESAGAGVRVKTRVEQLRREMDLAVACEDFEQAAVIRDELRGLTLAQSDGGERA